MSTKALSPLDIRKLGLEALAKTLGPVGMARFLQQFESGKGNYTKERMRWLKERDVKTVVKEIKSKRKAK